MSDATGPPSPGGWPLVGHAVQFLRDPFPRMEEWAEHGGVVRLRFPGRPTYLVTDPALIEEVLVSGPGAYERGELVRRTFGPLAEHALSAAEGDQWRRLRTAFQPAFTPERVDAYGDVVVERAGAWATERADGEVVDLELEMRRLTLAIFADALFGIDVRDGEEGEAVRELAAAITGRSDYTRLDPYVPDWVPTAANRRFRRAVGTLRDRVAHRIDRHAAGETTGGDFLSMLLAMRDAGEVSLSDEQLGDNVIGFLWAGQDTTSLAMTYTWYLLATHDDERERLAEELDDVLGGGRPASGDLDDLEFTDRVLREAMRLYPPAPTTVREPTEDVVLGEYEVPAGATILLPQWAVHRDDRWFDDPAAFRPDRWTGSFEEALPEYAYFPFGGGPRHCIGMRFARTELRLILATVARDVRLEPLFAEPLEFGLAATLRPETEMRFRVERSG